MCKFDVYIPVEGTDYHEYYTSVYADSQEEAEELASKIIGMPEPYEIEADFFDGHIE